MDQTVKETSFFNRRRSIFRVASEENLVTKRAEKELSDEFHQNLRCIRFYYAMSDELTALFVEVRIEKEERKTFFDKKAPLITIICKLIHFRACFWNQIRSDFSTLCTIASESSIQRVFESELCGRFKTKPTSPVSGTSIIEVQRIACRVYLPFQLLIQYLIICCVFLVVSQDFSCWNTEWMEQKVQMASHHQNADSFVSWRHRDFENPGGIEQNGYAEDIAGQ